jgi:hypothetical protein
MSARALALPRLDGDRRSIRRKALTHALLGVLPVLLTLDIAHYTFHHGHIQAFDFHFEFWPAAHRLLHGVSPYDPAAMHIQASIAFPYPAFTAVAFVPFALLNHALADWIFTALNIGCALLALRVLKVRDWRLYGLALILWPVVIAWQVANVTLPIVLGIALLWRKRDHPLVAGVLLAAMISLKPFVWPLALWLLATRRYRALAYAAVCGAIINAISWTIVGWGQIHAYTALTSAVDHVMDRRGYGIFSLVMQLGGSRGLAYALGIAAAAAVAVACFVVGRRGHTRAALTLAIALCLLATPVLWTHYFALMLIPLALCRPRLDRVWLVPLAMVACPAGNPEVWQILVALVASTTVFVALLRSPRAGGSKGERAAARTGTPKLAIALEG